MDSLSSFLNVKEVSAYLALRTSKVYSLVEEKQIPHYRIGRQLRFRKSDIDEWIEKKREEVVDAIVEARRVTRSLQRRPNLDVDRIVKKTIDDVRGRRYTSGNGKPDQVSDLRKEA